jgi:hypothetical protein
MNRALVALAAAVTVAHLERTGGYCKHLRQRWPCRTGH